MFATIYLPNFYLQAATRHQPELRTCTVQFHDNRNLSEKVSRVIEQFAKCEIAAQAAIAPTPDTSFLAANLARPLLQIENAKDFLVPLPIETLAIAGGGE